MIDLFRTPRLTLREFTLADAPFILQLLNTPGWLEYIGDRNVHSIADAENYLRNGPMKSYAENGYGLSMVEESLHKTPVGMCGLINRSTLDAPDIGFAFLPEFQNLGYGFEIASKTIEHVRSTTAITQVMGIVTPHNVASVKLLEKLGMVYVKNMTLPGESTELQLYSTT